MSELNSDLQAVDRGLPTHELATAAIDATIFERHGRRIEAHLGLEVVNDPVQAVLRDRRRLASIVEVSGLALWSWHVESDEIVLDDAGAKLWGLSSSHAMTFTSLVALTHPDDQHRFQQELLKRGPLAQIAFDCRVLQRGSARWLSVRGCVDPVANSEVVMIGVFTDITDQKVAEAGAAEAREAGDLLRAVIEAVPALIYVKDRQGRIQVANSPVMDLVGRPWEEICNRTDAEFLDDPVQAAKIMANDQHLMTTGGKEELEEIVGSDVHGPRIWLSQKSAFLGADGKVRGLVGASFDITARKRSEQQILSNELKLRRVIDSMFTFLGIMDLHGILVEANRAPVEGAGLTFEDVLGIPLWEAYWWSHNSDTSERIKAAVERGRLGETSRFDVEIRWRDDSRIMIDFQIAPVLNEAGDVIQLIPSGVDVTARYSAEIQREILINELDHRVKNLFMIASSMIALSARHARTVEELAKAVTGRLAALAHAHSLIEPAIKGKSDGQGAELESLINAIVAPYRDLLAADQIRLAGPPVHISGEVPAALALVLHELATNAAKYGALSVPNGHLSVNWSVTGENLVLVWSESGGPPVSGKPARNGFGSKLIHVTTSGTLGGTIDYEWLPVGLQVTLVCPNQTVK